ncbi:MAG: hypothetical protein ABIO72_03725 [Patescibacteria group bacterium]
MNHSKLALVFCAAIALFPAACDNGAGTGGSDDGSGGDASVTTNTTTSSSGSEATSSTGDSMSTTSTGSDACHPTEADPYCLNAPSCQCNAMPAGMPAEAPCPNNAGNVCEPGHNQCGCDLEMGTDYQAPDTQCANNVDGDTWEWEDGQNASATYSETNANGQLTTSFGAAFSPDVSYFNGFVVSAKSLNFNLANQAMLDYCSGEFSADCKSVTLSCWHAGESTPFKQKTLVYVHP